MLFIYLYMKIYITIILNNYIFLKSPLIFFKSIFLNHNYKKLNY
jgi:hypothetical protein